MNKKLAQFLPGQNEEGEGPEESMQDDRDGDEDEDEDDYDSDRQEMVIDD